MTLQLFSNNCDFFSTNSEFTCHICFLFVSSTDFLSQNSDSFSKILRKKSERQDINSRFSLFYPTTVFILFPPQDEKKVIVTFYLSIPIFFSQKVHLIIWTPFLRIASLHLAIVFFFNCNYLFFFFFFLQL